MSDKTMSVKVLNVVKTTAQWAAEETIISKGLLCIEFATNGSVYVKVGDGTKQYSQLPYVDNGNIDLSNYYTIAETDSAISDAISAIGKVVTIKGVVATYNLLPSSGNNVGDIWFVGPNAGQSSDDEYLEYIWVQPNAQDASTAKWEYLGKHQIDVADATTTTKGIIKIASQITDTGTDATTTATTPALVKGYVDTAISGIDTGVTSVNGTSGRVVATGDDNVTIDLASSGATAGTYGLSTATTGSDGSSINIPKMTVDTYGRVTSIENVAYVAGSHPHTNKAILDATEESFTTALKNKLDGLENYTLPNASSSTLGGIKVGNNLSINSSGVLSATDTTYDEFDGATSSTAGSSGLVPAPSTTDTNKFLKGDGSWATAYDDTSLANRVTTIENDYIKSTDTLILNCTL